MVNPDLAGGALLDLGIYALTWVFQTLYHTQPESARQAPTVVSSLKKYPTGADEMTTMLLTFPRSSELGGDAHGIATTAFRTSPDPDGKGNAGPAIRVQGDKGEIQVFHPAFRPSKTKLVLADGTVEASTTALATTRTLRERAMVCSGKPMSVHLRSKKVERRVSTRV
jgi:dihydrodiol dehydrogenase / D-xylose 1-dehydrogenase (NADP)